MPMYGFECEKCKHQFETLCSMKTETKDIHCEKCDGPVFKLLSMPGAVIFANPKGTSREDNFDYVAKYNYERAQKESRDARAAAGGEAYKHIDDMPQFEGKIGDVDRSGR